MPLEFKFEPPQEEKSVGPEPIDWAVMKMKYGQPSPTVPLDVYRDIRNLIGYIVWLSNAMRVCDDELVGARQTVMAMAKMSGGSFEVPYDVVVGINDDDELHVEDVTDPETNASRKRFTYVAGPSSMKVV